MGIVVHIHDFFHQKCTFASYVATSQRLVANLFQTSFARSLLPKTWGILLQSLTPWTLMQWTPSIPGTPTQRMRWRRGRRKDRLLSCSLDICLCNCDYDSYYLKYDFLRPLSGVYLHIYLSYKS